MKHCLIESLEPRLVFTGLYIDSLALVDDGNPGSKPAEVVASLVREDELFYIRTVGDALQLWQATNADVQMLTEVYLPTRFPDFTVTAFEAVGGDLYFAAHAAISRSPDYWTSTDDGGTLTLWRFDLAEGETHYLGELTDSDGMLYWGYGWGPAHAQFHDNMGQLLLSVREPVTPSTQLWTSDGTVAGTSPYTAPLAAEWLPGVQELLHHNDAWYFLGGRYDQYGLYRSEPGESITYLASFDVDVLFGIGPHSLREWNDQLVFSGYEEVSASGVPDYQLWTSDGTPEGTQLTVDSSVSVFGEINDELWMVWRDDDDGSRVMATDGAFDEAREVVPLPLDFFGFLHPTIHGDAVYFAFGHNPEGPTPPDRTSATLGRLDERGLTAVHQFDSRVRQVKSVDQWLYITDAENQLWAHQGTMEPTLIGSSLRILGSRSDGTIYLSRDGQIYVMTPGDWRLFEISHHPYAPLSSWPKSVTSASHGVTYLTQYLTQSQSFADEAIQLASHDGGDASTLELPLLLQPYGKMSLASLDTKTFVLGQRESRDHHSLVVYDSTTDQWTTLVEGTRESGISNQSAITTTDELFAMIEGGRFWTSDGTAAGTVSTDIPIGSMTEDFLIEIDGWFYFADSQLWVTDGTPDNTFALRVPRPTEAVAPFRDGIIVQSRDVTYWVSFENKPIQLPDLNASHFGPVIHGHLYYTQGDRQLWSLSEEPGSTPRLVFEFPDLRLPEYGETAIRYLTTDGDRLFFTMDDGIHGNELWVSDGSEDGTVLAADINPGSFPSSPSNLTVANGYLYFAATNREFGRELFAIHLDQEVSPKTPDFNNDQITDIADFLVLASNFGKKQGASFAEGDADEDGDIDFRDFLILSNSLRE